MTLYTQWHHIFASFARTPTCQSARHPDHWCGARVSQRRHGVCRTAVGLVPFQRNLGALNLGCMCNELSAAPYNRHAEQEISQGWRRVLQDVFLDLSQGGMDAGFSTGKA